MGVAGLSNITLFSETDPLGTIIFVNSAFCEVSGYSREELMGKPHNIVRHPDMPKKVFEVLWSTIKQGETFRGVIKNKSKDNSHYWVKALIHPIFGEQGKIAKYVGVRHLIADDSIASRLFEEQFQQKPFAC